MKQTPIEHIKQGRLEASIWENQGNQGQVFYSATFSRSYVVDRNAEKPEFKNTSSFNERDLPALSKLANDTHTRIQELEQEQRQEQVQDEKPSQQVVPSME